MIAGCKASFPIKEAVRGGHSARPFFLRFRYAPDVYMRSFSRDYSGFARQLIPAPGSFPIDAHNASRGRESCR